MECGTQGPVGNIRTYRTRAIITHGLYTFYPHFEVRLCTVTFGLKYGLYSRAVSNQERIIVTCVRYIFSYHLRCDFHPCCTGEET